MSFDDVLLVGDDSNVTTGTPVVEGASVNAEILEQTRAGYLADPDKSRDAMIATGQRLRDVDGADVLIMGCAGMAQYRDVLEAETGLPVVEPCQAGAALAKEFAPGN